jgi:hypothetical protein
LPDGRVEIVARKLTGGDDTAADRTLDVGADLVAASVSSEKGDPFAMFAEWRSAADDAAYKGL